MRLARGLPIAVLPSLALVVCLGCADGSGDHLSVTPDPRLATALPVPGRHLDRSSPAHAGVLSQVGSDGLPSRHGPEVDPLIIEARRFYDTLQYPRAEAQPVDYPDPFSGERVPMR